MPDEHFQYTVGQRDRDYCPCHNGNYRDDHRRCDCDAWVNNVKVCCDSTFIYRNLWETFLAAEKLSGREGGNLYRASMIQPDPKGKKTKQSVYKIPFVYAPGHVRVFYLCVHQFQWIFRLSKNRVAELTALSKRREALDKQDCGPYRWCGKDRMTFATHTKEKHYHKATYFPKPAVHHLGIEFIGHPPVGVMWLFLWDNWKQWAQVGGVTIRDDGGYSTGKGDSYHRHMLRVQEAVHAPGFYWYRDHIGR